jgi:hypothetical protein
MDMIIANSFRFDESSDANAEQWGYWKDDDSTVVIIGSIFNKIMKQGGFQGKSFLSWAKKKNLIECDSSGKTKKLVRFQGKPARAVVLKTTYNVDESAILGALADEMYEDLPFK